jgi:hypothetical protein
MLPVWLVHRVEAIAQNVKVTASTSRVPVHVSVLLIKWEEIVSPVIFHAKTAVLLLITAQAAMF